MNLLSLDRLWFDGRGAWRIAAPAALLMLGVLVWGWQTWRLVRADASALSQQLDAPHMPKAGGSWAAPAGDFTSGLAEVPRVTEVVQAVHHAAAEARVSLLSLQLQARPATTAQLARAELSVSLRGPYLGVRQVLDDVLGRYPDVGVSRLRVRRAPAVAGHVGGSALEVEAAVALSVWGRLPNVGAASQAGGR